MSSALVLFGTTDGHTARIAHAAANALRAGGVHVDVLDARDAIFVSPSRFDAVLVLGSLHAKGYQRAVTRWVKENARSLARRPTAFISVCLGVLEHQPATDRHLETIMQDFFTATGWTPQQRTIVAGALPYTRYGWLKKRIMRRIAAKAGGDTDITRDFEYTDWAAVTAFVEGFGAQLRKPASACALPPRYPAGETPVGALAGAG